MMGTNDLPVKPAILFIGRSLMLKLSYLSNVSQSYHPGRIISKNIHMLIKTFHFFCTRRYARINALTGDCDIRESESRSERNRLAETAPSTITSAKSCTVRRVKMAGTTAVPETISHSEREEKCCDCHVPHWDTRGRGDNEKHDQEITTNESGGVRQKSCREWLLEVTSYLTGWK